MKICVYGAASEEISKKYLEAAEALGFQMAQRGHSLVFGGGATGLMGAAARGVIRGGGKILGIAPEFFRMPGVLIEGDVEMVYTRTMRERKQLMEEKSDAFVMTPGGIGTFEEFFEILTLKQLGRHDKPIAVLNVDGYYDRLLEFLDHAKEEGFLNRGCRELFGVFEHEGELLSYLERM